MIANKSEGGRESAGMIVLSKVPHNFFIHARSQIIVEEGKMQNRKSNDGRQFSPHVIKIDGED